jgi:hypothetical protein
MDRSEIVETHSILNTKFNICKFVKIVSEVYYVVRNECRLDHMTIQLWSAKENDIFSATPNMSAEWKCLKTSDKLVLTIFKRNPAIMFTYLLVIKIHQWSVVTE